MVWHQCVCGCHSKIFTISLQLLLSSAGKVTVTFFYDVVQFECTPPHCYKNLDVSSIVVLDEHAHVFASRAPHSSPL